MKKKKIWIFMAAFSLVLTGCGKPEPEPLAVYSFCGENEQLAVSNGVIVLHDTEEIFSGGDLEVTGAKFEDITFYSTRFYVLSGTEEEVIFSNAMEDLTGGIVSVPDDLGKMAGESVLSRVKLDDAGAWKNNFYFELVTRNTEGKVREYQVQLLVEEVTK